MNHYDVKATRLRRKGKNIPDLQIKPIWFIRYSIARFCLLYSPFLALPTLAPHRATTRSLPPSHAPQALSPLAPHCATTRSSSPSHAPQALPPLALLRTTTRSTLRNHSLLATLSCPTGSFKSCSLPRHHTLLATLPRPKIPLNTPCFVTRKIMAEGAK